MENIPTTFVSLVGMQVMAVLNPLLALQEQKGYVAGRILLLSTRVNETRDRRILDFVKYRFPQAEVSFFAVSDSMKEDARGNPPVNRVLPSLVREHKRITFNIGGGLTFQIASALSGLSDDGWRRCAVVYPEMGGINVIRFGANTAFIEVLKLPRNLDVDRLLTLQGVSWSAVGNTRVNPFARLLAQQKIRWHKIPEARKVAGVVFDDVWNSGNSLVLLKVVDGAPETTKGKVREVLAVASRRQDFGDLLHRKLVVVTSSAVVLERCVREGQGKIEPVFLGKKKAPMLQEYNVTETPVLKSGPRHPDRTLVTMLGKDILPTLIAVWSHGAGRVILGYTPEDTQIQRYVHALKAHRSLLPSKRVELWPATVTGESLLDVAKPRGEIEVNITPGSKGQVCFLSRWAGKHGASMYSLKGDTQELGIISGPRPRVRRPLSAPDPVTILRLSGSKVYSHGPNKTALLTAAPQLKQIHEFLHELVELKGGLLGFPAKTTNTGRTICTPSFKTVIERGKEDTRLDSFVIKVATDTGRLATYNARDGSWLEELVGFEIACAGADDVQVRIRTAWSYQRGGTIVEGSFNCAEPARKPVFRTDIDVVARFASSLFVVSVKTNLSTKIKNPRFNLEYNKVKADAALFGRFVMPLIMILRYDGPPKLVGGVTVFGFRTLIDGKELAGLFRKTADSHRTTRRVHPENADSVLGPNAQLQAGHHPRNYQKDKGLA